MNDTAQLLNQLKIDRDPPRPQRGGGRGLLLAVVVLVLAAVGAWAWSLRPEQPLPVRIAIARPAAVQAPQGSVLDASGYVVARREATVSSKITGKVEALLFEEGQAVSEGQVLARLDASNARAELALAQAQLAAQRSSLAEIEVRLADARRTADRNRTLAARGLLPQASADDAQASQDALAAQLAAAGDSVTVSQRQLDVRQRALDDTVVRAPYAGVITVKNAQPGEMISPLSAGGDGTRTGVGTLVDMESLEIEVDVNENFINRVRPDQPVSAKLNAYPDWQLPGHVIAVVPTADRSKATVKVRIALEQRDARVLPEMGVRVAFLDAQPTPSEAPPQGLVVPVDAVDGSTVWRVGPDSRLSHRQVTLAGRYGGGWLITGGINDGERVAIGEFAQFSEGRAVAAQ